MKIKQKSILTILSISALFATANAKDFTIPTGGVITPFESGANDYDIYYAGTAGQQARLGMISTWDGYTVKTMHFKSGDGTSTFTPSDWNLLGRFTLDSGATSGEVSVLTSNEIVNLQMGKIDITNTAASSTATAIIDMGASYLKLHGGGAAEQKPVLNIETNTNFITTGDTAINLSSKASIIVSKNSTFKVNGNITSTSASTTRSTVSVESGSTMSLNGVFAGGNLDYTIKGTYNQNGNTSFQNGSVVSIDGKYNILGGTALFAEGSSATVNGTILLTAAGTITVNSGVSFDFGTTGTLSPQNGSNFIMNGNMKYGKAITFAKMATAGTFTQSAGNVTLTRPTDFNSGANWTVYSRLYLNGGGSSDLLLASVNVKEGSHINIAVAKAGDVGAIVFNDNSKLTVSQENAFKNTFDETIALVAAGKNTKLVVNADQTLSFINSLQDFVIEMNNSSKLTFTSENALIFNEDKMLKIFNFEENTIYVGTNSQLAETIAKHVQLFDSSSQLLGYAKVNNGFLSAITVPEPAEWAAIFGAIALAFAAYRRRK